MRKYKINDPLTKARNHAFVEKREQANFEEFAQECETVEIVGPFAWKFLKMFGKEHFQDILDEVQEDIDEMELFEVLVIESEYEGMKYRLSFVKEYEETRKSLAQLRVSFVFI